MDFGEYLGCISDATGLIEGEAEIDFERDVTRFEIEALAVFRDSFVVTSKAGEKNSEIGVDGYFVRVLCEESAVLSDLRFQVGRRSLGLGEEPQAQQCDNKKHFQSLEEELDGEFDNTVALLLGGDAEVRTGIGEAAVGILGERESQVAAVERVERVIQEVIRLNTELELH